VLEIAQKHSQFCINLMEEKMLKKDKEKEKEKDVKEMNVSEKGLLLPALRFGPRYVRLFLVDVFSVLYSDLRWIRHLLQSCPRVLREGM
jgi:hypothetical protein